jgi:hypothetical protein
LKASDNKSSEVASLSGGSYIYFGVHVGLTQMLTDKENELQATQVLELAMNIDGVPLFRSSSYSLWPVLCSVVNIKTPSVFVVALYGGKSKPSNLDFLSDTIQELNKLITEGISMHGKQFKIILKYCVCVMLWPEPW